ncbi:hypothetical protein Mapa_014744 [Marchantia paleacea]|nr:hypothetical protein Mapa_014744 [Marchantia paleacea]
MCKPKPVPCIRPISSYRPATETLMVSVARWKSPSPSQSLSPSLLCLPHTSGMAIVVDRLHILQLFPNSWLSRKCSNIRP